MQNVQVNHFMIHTKNDNFYLKSCLSPFKRMIWLITGGIKDLKIYVDLALLSVEGDEQVGRVTHLHSAAIGFSSVIFGNFSGENEMIDAWMEVWEHFEKDNDLPIKLVFTQNIKNVKLQL